MNEKDLKRIKEEIADSDNLIARYRLRESIDEQRGWEMFQKKFQSHGKRHSYHLHAAFRRIAVIVAVLITGGLFWFHHDYTRVTPPVINEDVRLAMQQSKESGHHAADVVSVNANHSELITQQERELYHVDDDFVKQLTEAKRITTYKDKEFWVTLEDGTLVHLNNNSKLIFPEKFGDRRDVILDGEAYFMVAKDKSRQFVVHTPQGDVKVYGTEFFINTGTDEKGIDRRPVAGEMDREADSYSAQDLHTTVILVNGSVGFTSSDGKEVVMTPRQQLTAGKGSVSVNVVDTAPYVAWNTGLFVFKGSPLEYLMDVLSQWYGIHHVEYASDSLRTIRFTGNLKRYGNIDRILEAIMLACDMNIQLSDDVITIQD